MKSLIVLLFIGTSMAAYAIKPPSQQSLRLGTLRIHHRSVPETGDTAWKGNQAKK